MAPPPPSRRQPQVNRQRQSAGHKRRRKCTIKKETTIKESEVECKLHDLKNCGQSQEGRKQGQKKDPILKLGIRSLNLPSLWRARDSTACYICGERNHNEHFCPYNYIYGLYCQFTCRAQCLPGQHTIASIARRDFLECFVRVNNMPPSFKQQDLGRLFKPFGPLLMWDVPLVTPEICRGIGIVIFKKREDGERAINELNGYNAGGHKLRVDWAYPCV